MTTVCTERDIPDAAGKMDDELFDGAVMQSQYSYFYKMGWNESEWAKLGMSDTLYKVNTHIQNTHKNTLVDLSRDWCFYSYLSPPFSMLTHTHAHARFERMQQQPWRT